MDVQSGAWSKHQFAVTAPSSHTMTHNETKTCFWVVAELKIFTLTVKNLRWRFDYYNMKNRNSVLWLILVLNSQTWTFRLIQTPELPVSRPSAELSFKPLILCLIKLNPSVSKISCLFTFVLPGHENIPD